MNYNLEPLWNEILKVYAEFARICAKHGLRHYAAYGTAIGAVRHKGFIPWDDDFDVVMPREDYEKFVAVAQTELPSWLTVLSRRLQADYYHVFNKVKVIDDSVVRKVQALSNLDLSEGIYIDIFPLDGAPNSFLGRQCYWLQRWTYRALGIYLEGVKSYKHSLLWLIGWFMHFMHPDAKDGNDAMFLLENWAMRYKFSDSN